MTHTERLAARLAEVEAEIVKRVGPLQEEAAEIRRLLQAPALSPPRSHGLSARVLSAVLDSPAPVRANDVARAIGHTGDTISVSVALVRLGHRGLIVRRERGLYAPPPKESA